MTFKVEIDDKSSNTIIVHMDILGKHSLKRMSFINVKIGAWEKNVQIKSHYEKNQSVIFLSKDIAEEVNLLKEISYEVLFSSKFIQIGPVIGMLIRGKKEAIDSERLKIYFNYVAGYNQLKGLILLFTEDGINEEMKTINGYAYNPKTLEWNEGIYPFPSACFCRKKINKKLRQRFQQLIGSHYFNSYVFSKLEMYEWLLQSNRMQSHLPETVSMNNMEEVKRLIDNYENIFLKPLSGMQGHGIYQLQKDNRGFIFRYRLNKQNITSVVDNWEAASAFIETKITPEKYLAQQAIPLLKLNNRVLDFRVIVQKDHHGNWIPQDIISRYGEKESIVSNISNGGIAEKGWATLMKFYEKDSRAAFQKYKEMQKLATDACVSFEKTGIHLGSIGLDIGMDEKSELWIIEANNREPDMTIALDANDSQLYYQMKAMPLQYAKWLSGYVGDYNVI
jgi:hypothetical protein